MGRADLAYCRKHVQVVRGLLLQHVFPGLMPCRLGLPAARVVYAPKAKDKGAVYQNRKEQPVSGALNAEGHIEFAHTQQVL